MEEALQSSTETLTKILSSKFVNLSQVGKLIHINTILTILASHIISIYLLPKKKITKKLTLIFLKFWRASSLFDKKPIYWIKREILERHKMEGGLSFRHIEYTNKALLFN